MQAYMFQAALYCEDCGADICKGRLMPEGMEENDENTWDSNDYPKGPYPNGGGEADTPQHCDYCAVFLGNPLTNDGREYVHEAVNLADEERRKKGRHDFQSVALDIWGPFYKISPNE